MRYALPFVLCLLSSVASPAWAGTAEEEARKNFEEGLALESTQPEAACVSFRKSLEFTRELGPLTKVKECDVREGRLLEAREKLRELTSRLLQEDPDLPALKEELIRVEARIARVEIVLNPELKVGVRVTLDAKPVTVPGGVEVDPRAHELVVETEGKPVERSTLTLTDGETKRVQVPSDELLRQVPVPGPTREEGITGLGIAGVVIGSAGVAGLIGGAITGGLVLSKRDEFEDCKSGTPAGCDPVALKSTGDTLLIANGALLIGGGVLTAIGATLFIVDLASAPSDETPTESAPSVALHVGLTSASFGLSF
jgi:hypothetical protein